MKRIVVWSLCALIVQAAFQKRYLAQSGTAVEGVVLEAGTDKPLPQVRVILATESEPKYFFGASQPSGGEALTDARGRFTVETKPGRYRVVPSLEGFVYSRPAYVRTAREAGVWVQVVEGRRMQNVQLRMVREGVITGRILDAKGQPVPGRIFIPGAPAPPADAADATASLTIYAYDDYGRRQLTNVPGISYPGAAFSFTRTNDRGEYRLYGLQPGEYYLALNSTGVRVFFPGVKDEADAVPIRVTPGEEVQLGNVTLPPPETRVPVRLHLMQTGLPSGFSLLSFLAANMSFVARPGDDPNLMAFNLVPGHYDGLVISQFMARNELFYGEARFDVSNSAVDQDVVIRKAPHVVGAVVREDAGGNRESLPALGCNLVSTESYRTAVRARSGCDVQVAPGLYQLELLGLPQDTYVVSIKSSDQDVLSAGMRVEGDMKIDVLLRKPGAVIEGIVTNSKDRKISDAVVALVPNAPMRSAGLLYRSTISDLNGKFELRGVSPGNYKLFAWSDISGAAYRNAEFIKKFEDLGTPLRIEKAGPFSRDLKIVDEPREATK